MQCHCSECGVCAGGVSQCSDISFPGCIIRLRKSGSLEQCCFDDIVQLLLGCNNTLRDNGALSLTPYEYCCTEDFCNTEQALRSAIAARSTPVNVVSTSTSPLPSPTTAVGSDSENSGIGNIRKKILYIFYMIIAIKLSSLCAGKAWMHDAIRQECKAQCKVCVYNLFQKTFLHARMMYIVT